LSQLKSILDVDNPTPEKANEHRSTIENEYTFFVQDTCEGIENVMQEKVK